MCRRIFSVMGMGLLATLLLSSAGVAYQVNAVPPGFMVAYAAPTASGQGTIRIAQAVSQARTRLAARSDEPTDRHTQSGSRPDGSSPRAAVSDGALPPVVQQILTASFPHAVPEKVTDSAADAATLAAAEHATPDKGRFQTRLSPNDSTTPDGESPTGAEQGYSHIEIEVSHSRHEFKLLRGPAFGQKEILHECRVGLGNPREFPTPVGVYFVTHIYDDDPWWIPPANRPWAWGQSPSRKVYGGIMAPLLKKRTLPTRKKAGDSEDFVAELVRLDDDGYRFHGTNAPRSIGRNESHGCVRMLPADVKKVAELIKDNVGIASRQESENGTYVILKAPVRLNLIK
ncbi:MAG: L,D-transpeptidase [Desulfomonile tiedjei]|nr:L,D-transpeptidase [Desulfomonile tiedjei]